jgi:hypothetical protein
MVGARGRGAPSTSKDAPSGVETTTPLVVESTPLDGASGVQMTTQIYLRTPAYRPAVQEVEDGSDGAATPPLADGLAATAAETPPGGFEGFWNSYAHKQKRDKAKTAWAKLDPSPDLVATIIAEAGRWAEHYAKHNVEPRWRVLPHNWLAGEGWLQDLPIIHTDAKSAAISKVRGSAKTTKASDSVTRTTARVTAADVVTTEGITVLRFTATDEAGIAHERIVTVQHDDEKTQFAGQKLLASLVKAAGLEQIEDSADLLGRTIIISGDGFAAPDTRPNDEPPVPVKTEPVLYANAPPSKPLTDADVEKIRARVAAAPRMPRAKPFHISDGEREAWTADEDDDGDWPDAEYGQDDAA